MDKDDASVSTESPRDIHLLSTSSENAVAAQERISQLHEKVFGNYLIRQEIIHHYLRFTVASSDFPYTDNETSLSSKAAKTLRLINSTWCKDSNQSFFRSKIPLLAFKIYHPTFSTSHNHTAPGYNAMKSFEMVKYLEFLMYFLDKPLEKTPPPFSLSFIIYEPLLFPIDIWHLQNMFNKRWLISSLVKLAIKDIERFNRRVRHTCCPEVASDLKLPCLKELYIDYTTDSPDDKFLDFINAILNAALYLKKLSLEVPVSSDKMYWTLPRTLTHLHIHSEGIIKRLTTLNKSSPTAPIFLPKLKMLEVYGSDQPFGTLDIPTMGKLASTMTHLEKMAFRGITERGLKNTWCHPGWKNWPTVKTLVVHNFHHMPPSDYMASIHKSFPSVVHFDLHIIFDHQMPPLGEWSSQLQYLFQEMSNLKSLKLNMWCMKYSQEYVMDSIFLGVSLEKATQLRQDPTLWDNFLKQGHQEDSGEQQKCGGGGGIKNFRCLKSLLLNCISDFTPYHAIPRDLRPPRPGIISPLVFRLGFMQLPQLEYLALGVGFSIGMEEIGDEWLKQSPTRKLRLWGHSIIDYLVICMQVAWKSLGNRLKKMFKNVQSS